MITHQFTGDIKADVKSVLYANNKAKTYDHVKAVAEMNIKIAEQYGLDKDICELCGYLHDISAVVSHEKMMEYAINNGWDIDESERKFPMLLHQRISRVIAQEDFGVTDERILSAVEHHSTLKANPTAYDMAVFIADKLAWDGDGEAPFYAVVNNALRQSLEAASLAYQDYIVEHKIILHPHRWFEDSVLWLRGVVGNTDIECRQFSGGSVRIETQRLTLRNFSITDAEAMFRNWASDPDVVHFMPYDVCHSIEDTQKRITEWMRYFEETAPNSAVFAIELKNSGEVIGTIDFAETDKEARSAEVGYQIGKAWWGHGYTAEALRAVIKYFFETVKLNRLWASYDPRNTASGKVLQKAGMIYEGTLRQCKIRRGELADSVRYAILAEDWEITKEIAYYKTLPCTFDGFIEVPELTDGVLRLVCTQKRPAIPEKKYVPAYDFAVCKGSEKVGEINLRIGYGGFGPDESSLYYGGQIGYGIDEQHRGNGYAVRACRLLLPVAKAHHMTRLLITNHIHNEASRRVCEKLGLHLIRTARLPEWHDLYKDGQRFVNIYEWEVV